MSGLPTHIVQESNVGTVHKRGALMKTYWKSLYAYGWFFLFLGPVEYRLILNTYILTCEKTRLHTLFLVQVKGACQTPYWMQCTHSHTVCISCSWVLLSTGINSQYMYSNSSANYLLTYSTDI